MAVAITFSPAEWLSNVASTITVTGLTGATPYDVQVWDGAAPVVNPSVGGTSEAGYGGGHTQRIVSDGGGTITLTYTPAAVDAVSVAVFAAPVQQGTTATVNVEEG